MTSSDRKRSSLSTTGSEWPSRASRPRSRDSGADSSSDVTGGAGRRDEVGHTGIYPAGSEDAPQDADVRTPGEFGRSRRDPAE